MVRIPRAEAMSRVDLLPTSFRNNSRLKPSRKPREQHLGVDSERPGLIREFDRINPSFATLDL